MRFLQMPLKMVCNDEVLMIYFRTSMIVSELFNVENELFLFIDLAELWNFDFSSCIEFAGVSIWKQRYVKSFVLRIYIVLVLY